MRYRRHFLFLLPLAMLFTLVACSGSDDDSPSSSGVNANANSTSVSPYAQRLEFPHLQSSGTRLLVHLSNGVLNYAVEWDVDRSSQLWSCYEMDSSLCQIATSRYSGDPQYPQDPLLATDDLIRGSGFDHGHICPSADRLSSEELNYQTFFLTNMQPQLRYFNGGDNSRGWGIWYHSENAIRQLARDRSFCDTLYICKGGTIGRGGTLSDQILQQRSNGLLVPGYFFVALLRVHDGQYNAIGLLFHHEENTDSRLAPYAMTIDELEEYTGFDFFCNLPDSREQVIERTATPALWGFTR